MSQVIEILKSTSAIIGNNHFVGTSGKHFDTYVNKDALYIHTQKTSLVCKLMAEKVKDLEVEVVVGPSVGGIILSQWVAFHLSEIKQKEILSVYTEKDESGNQIFKRGYNEVVFGKKVLVVEDLTTTGGSAKKVVETANSAGANVVGVLVMVNRNPKEVNEEFFETKFYFLDTLEIPAFLEEECPLCKAGVPVNTKVGHGKKFLENKGIKYV